MFVLGNWRVKATSCIAAIFRSSSELENIARKKKIGLTHCILGPIFVLIKVSVSTQTQARGKGMAEDSQGAIKESRTPAMN